MKILVLGATGSVGRLLVAEGLKRGHRITALVRDASKIQQQSPNLRVVVGNVLDDASVTRALEGQDAVAYAIGVRSPKPTTLFSDSTRKLVALMEQQGVKRLVCITGVGAGESKGHGGFLYDRIGYPLITKNIYLDKDRQEEVIRRSSLEWTIVRPTVFREGLAKSEFQAVTDVKDVVLRRISRQEVANFALDELEDARFVHQSPFIGHAHCSFRAISGHPGTYALILSSTTTASIHIGHLGFLQLQPGYYIYVGSALGPGGLRARLANHLRPAEHPHWHIDYLKSVTKLEHIGFCYGRKRREHLWARRVAAMPGTSVPMVGFGSSDCECASHLFFFKELPDLAHLHRQHRD